MSNQKLISTIKEWLKDRNSSPKYALISTVLHYCRDLYRFHPKERFLNRLILWYKTTFGSWNRLSFTQSMVQRIFYVCSDNTAEGKIVIKIPRGDNRFSCRLVSLLRNTTEYEKYRQILFDFRENHSMRKHCATVLSVHRDGGYTSEFVEGFNLAHLRNYLFDAKVMPPHLREKLVIAVEELIENLNEYRKENGQLIGDWALPNLIFSPERSAIVNVDSEGFFSYGKQNTEISVLFIESVLKEMLQYLEILESQSPEDKKIINVTKILDEVRQSGKSYNGQSFIVGYHSLELKGKMFRGQRVCTERLSNIPYDFNNKVVADFGCNCGGMLHALSKEIKQGYGFDFNPKCVNAAHSVKKLNQSTNLEFFNFDLDRDNLSLLSCLMNEKIDICFLLSVCMWLKRWQMVVHHAVKIADTLLFESNGTATQQNTQVALLHTYFAQVSLIRDVSLDDPLQSERKLYLCTEKRISYHTHLSVSDYADQQIELGLK